MITECGELPRNALEAHFTNILQLWVIVLPYIVPMRLDRAEYTTLTQNLPMGTVLNLVLAKQRFESFRRDTKCLSFKKTELLNMLVQPVVGVLKASFFGVHNIYNLSV